MFSDDTLEYLTAPEDESGVDLPGPGQFPRFGYECVSCTNEPVFNEYGRATLRALRNYIDTVDGIVVADDDPRTDALMRQLNALQSWDDVDVLYCAIRDSDHEVGAAEVCELLDTIIVDVRKSTPPPQAVRDRAAHLLVERQVNLTKDDRGE